MFLKLKTNALLDFKLSLSLAVVINDEYQHNKEKQLPRLMADYFLHVRRVQN